MDSHSTDPIIAFTKNPETQFVLLELLGEGSYGKVYKAQHIADKQFYAVKIVNTTAGDLDNLKKEISILRDCSSEFVVQYYGSYLYNEQLWLIMEYCEVGSVSDLMRATQRTLSEVHIACILKSVLAGLSYLHNSKKIHRDVKAGNILINQQGQVKLADFGVSAELIHTLGYIESFIGTPFWMSPEILNKSKYNKKTDIWSMGITAIEMAEGVPPYSNLSQFKAIFEISKNPPKGLTDPSRWSVEFNAFVRRCLTYDPDHRPTAEELLKDPFIIRHTSRVSAELILADLIQASMGKIADYRRVLLERMRMRSQKEASGQPANGQVDDDEEEEEGGEEEEEDGEEQRSEQPHKQEGNSNNQSEFVVNESGTIIEYMDSPNKQSPSHQPQLLIMQGKVQGQQQFYKKSAAPSQSQAAVNVWENETGTMIQKDEEGIVEINSSAAQQHPAYSPHQHQQQQRRDDSNQLFNNSRQPAPPAAVADKDRSRMVSIEDQIHSVETRIVNLQAERDHELLVVQTKYERLLAGCIEALNGLREQQQAAAFVLKQQQQQQQQQMTQMAIAAGKAQAFELVNRQQAAAAQAQAQSSAAGGGQYNQFNQIQMLTPPSHHSSQHQTSNNSSQHQPSHHASQHTTQAYSSKQQQPQQITNYCYSEILPQIPVSAATTAPNVQSSSTSGSMIVLNDHLYSDIPLPATPKQQDKWQSSFAQQQYQQQFSQISNNNVAGVSSSQQSSRPNSSMLSRVPITPQAHSSSSSAQEEAIQRARRQFLNTQGAKTPSSSSQIEGANSAAVKRANNHPINLLNASSKMEKAAAISVNNNGGSSSSGGGMTFDEALSRKQMLKTNGKQLRPDENQVYAEQLQLQLQQRNAVTRGTPTKHTAAVVQVPLAASGFDYQANMLQQIRPSSQNNFANYIPEERLQTEDTRVEYMKRSSRSSANVQSHSPYQFANGASSGNITSASRNIVKKLSSSSSSSSNAQQHTEPTDLRGQQLNISKQQQQQQHKQSSNTSQIANNHYTEEQQQSRSPYSNQTAVRKPTSNNIIPGKNIATNTPTQQATSTRVNTQQQLSSNITFKQFLNQQRV